MILESLFGGIIAPLIGKGLDMWKDKQDKKHELEIFKLQIERDKLGHLHKMEEIETEGDIKSTEAIYEQAKLSFIGHKKIDAVVSLANQLVRPTITYWLVALYNAVKVAIFYSFLEKGVSWNEALKIIWTEADMALLCTVIGFWFSQRYLLKLIGKKN